MLVKAYKRKTKEFSNDLNLVEGYMVGIDIPLAFEEFKNLRSGVYNGGIMDKCECVDESQNIFRCLVNIPLFNQREFLLQLLFDDDNKCIMMKSVKNEKWPETKGLIRAQMTDLIKLETKEGKTFIREIISFDLGGWLPVSMMNMLWGSTIVSEYNEM